MMSTEPETHTFLDVSFRRNSGSFSLMLNSGELQMTNSLSFIRLLFLCNKIPQREQLQSTQIYYLRGSVGHKSGHGVARFSALGLRSWNQNVDLSYSSHLSSGLSSKFAGCWQTSLPRSLGLRSCYPSSSWLGLAFSSSMLPAVPYHVVTIGNSQHECLLSSRTPTAHHCYLFCHLPGKDAVLSKHFCD